jgi:hypothetical protein
MQREARQRRQSRGYLLQTPSNLLAPLQRLYHMPPKLVPPHPLPSYSKTVGVSASQLKASNAEDDDCRKADRMADLAVAVSMTDFVRATTPS